MDATSIELGGTVSYLQDLGVSSDGHDLLDLIEHDVPGYHRVNKTEAFQDPLEDDLMCCHRGGLLSQPCTGHGGSGGHRGHGSAAVPNIPDETYSLDLSPYLAEDFDKMYTDWQNHLGSIQGSDEDMAVDEVVSLAVGDNKPSARRRRQRNESIGPCIAPNLLHDTSKTVGAKSTYRPPRQRNESIGPCIPPDLLHDTSKGVVDQLINETVAGEEIDVVANDLDLSSDDDEQVVVEGCEDQTLVLSGSLPEVAHTEELPMSTFLPGNKSVSIFDTPEHQQNQVQDDEDDLLLAPETPGRGASAAAAAAVALLQEDDILLETPETPGGVARNVSAQTPKTPGIGVLKESVQTPDTPGVGLRKAVQAPVTPGVGIRKASVQTPETPGIGFQKSAVRTPIAKMNNVAAKKNLASLVKESPSVTVPKTPMSGLVPKTPGSSNSLLGSRNLKLPKGSIILAVVNEAGSLVPLPVTPAQLKSVKIAAAAASRSKIRSTKASPTVPLTPVTPVVSTSQEDDVDVETVMEEKTPVLEAGDLDSLLAQFEASEAVNVNGAGSPHHSDVEEKDCPPTPGKSCAKLDTPPTPGKETSKSISQPLAALSTPGKDLTKANPVPGVVPLTNQRIMDALPKGIIEKIKASTKRKSTQMLDEPMVVHKGRGVKLQDVSVRNTKAHRNQPKTPATPLTSAAKTPPTPMGSERIPPPMDHDYCFSPAVDKTLKSEDRASPTTPGNDIFNKLPDYYRTITSNKKCEEDSGKKDSGVESGDVSDASVDTDTHRTVARQPNSDIKQEKPDYNVTSKLPAYVTDISNSKRETEENTQVDDETLTKSKSAEVQKVKRKLNLAEYRDRVRSAASSRCASPVLTTSRCVSPAITESSVCSPGSSGHAAESEDIKAQAGGSAYAEQPTSLENVTGEKTSTQGTVIEEKDVDTQKEIGIKDSRSDYYDSVKDIKLCDNIASEVTVHNGGEELIEKSHFKMDCNNETKGEIQSIGIQEAKQERDPGTQKETKVENRLSFDCDSFKNKLYVEVKSPDNQRMSQERDTDKQEETSVKNRLSNNCDSVKDTGLCDNTPKCEVSLKTAVDDIEEGELNDNCSSQPMDIALDEDSSIKQMKMALKKENTSEEIDIILKEGDSNSELMDMAICPMQSTNVPNREIKKVTSREVTKSNIVSKPLESPVRSEAPAFQCVKVSPLNLGGSPTISTVSTRPLKLPTVENVNPLNMGASTTVTTDYLMPLNLPTVEKNVIVNTDQSSSIKNNQNLPVSSQSKELSGSPLKDGRSRKYQRPRNIYRHRSHSSSRSRSPSPKSSYKRSRNRSGNQQRKRNKSSSLSHSRSKRWESRSRSRGRSRSSSSSCSSNCSCSGSSRSRSRSKSRSRSRSRSRSTSRSTSRSYRNNRDRSRDYAQRHARSKKPRNYSYKSPSRSYSRRSRSPSLRRSRSPRRRFEDEERVKQVEDRRVIYIGRIAEGTTKAELRHRFHKFGHITDISVHFRDHGDNYGFVTYRNRDEAYKAIEHGNDDASLPQYDLCFGGRRAFCKVQYSDLDAQDEDDSGWGALRGSRSIGSVAPRAAASSASLDFDALLKAAMKKKR